MDELLPMYVSSNLNKPVHSDFICLKRFSKLKLQEHNKTNCYLVFVIACIITKVNNEMKPLSRRLNYLILLYINFYSHKGSGPVSDVLQYRVDP